MDSGFSPEFFLQIIVSVGSVGAMYGAIRSDLANMKRFIASEQGARKEAAEEEKRLREKHETEDHDIHHALRSDLQDISLRVAKVERE